ncbi:uncharacterized protein YALI1_C05562g [Yarrowia lipolytica]|uniref:Uncharacterized protein n=1 Tax=Yarrowia lipolytica TaxID=4952 RepID=A0A1D8N9L2_YARLL|nr:hypothetical protein YALI1_C05562g [Yarrowia lipolytica]
MDRYVDMQNVLYMHADAAVGTSGEKSARSQGVCCNTAQVATRIVYARTVERLFKRVASMLIPPLRNGKTSCSDNVYIYLFGFSHALQLPFFRW